MLVSIDKKYMIKDFWSRDRFHGTPKAIVFDMRFWDTGMGRCETNEEYMNLVSERLPGFPVYKDEVSFLNHLEKFELIRIFPSN